MQILLHSPTMHLLCSKSVQIHCILDHSQSLLFEKKILAVLAFHVGIYFSLDSGLYLLQINLLQVSCIFIPRSAHNEKCCWAQRHKG